MSPYTADAYPDNRFRLPPPRPTSVIVIAIFHLLLGFWGLLGAAYTGIFLAVGPMTFAPTPPPGAKPLPIPPDLAQRMQRYVQAECPYYTPYAVASLTLGLILSVMLIAAGIGLFSMRPWSRKLSLAYAVGSVALSLAGLIYMLAFFVPATSSFCDQTAQEFPASAPFLVMMRVTAWASAVFIPVGMAYPIVVFVLFRRPHVVAAFAGQTTPTVPPERAAPEPRGGPPPDAITR
jgi:hypothetical protein